MSRVYQESLSLDEINLKEAILNKISAFMRKHPMCKIYQSDAPVYVFFLSQIKKKFCSLLTK